VTFDTLSKDTPQCNVPVPGYSQYNSVEDGFCFIFPNSFEFIQEEELEHISLVGTEQPDSPEPAPATLTVQVRSSEGKTFEQALDELLAAYSSSYIVQASIAIEGKPAEILEQVPGDLPTRQALILANQRLFTFTVTPSEESYPSAFEDANFVWSSVLTTLHFFPPEAASKLPDGLDISSWAVTELTGLGMRFLLPPEWEMISLPDAFALAPRQDAIQRWITLRTYPDLLALEQATLIDALKEKFQEEGIAYDSLSAEVAQKSLETIEFFEATQ
jgi:hypothetical protein